MTSDIPTLSDLIDPESNSSDNAEDDDEEHGIPSAAEAIQALKTLKARFVQIVKAERKVSKTHIRWDCYK